MKYYAVIDTNVLVSALLSRDDEAATVQLLEHLLKGETGVNVLKSYNINK